MFGPFSFNEMPPFMEQMGGNPFMQNDMFDRGMCDSINKKVDTDEFYKFLNLKKEASPTEIKESYKKSVLIKHPDKGGSQEEFVKLKEAYDVLNDPEKKKIYDKHGKPGLEKFYEFKEMTKQFNMKPKPQPIIEKVMITLEESFLGCSKEVTVKRQKYCRSCDGEGFLQKESCPKCKGQTKVQIYHQVSGQTISVLQDCYNCKARGFVFKKDDTCSSCDSKGFTIDNKVFHIDIEKGVTKFKRLLPEEGNEVFGASEPGDVILFITEIPHTIFERYGKRDLICEVSLTLLEALTGFSFQLKHLNGKMYNITNKTGDSFSTILEPNNVITIPKMGFCHDNNPKKLGELKIKINIIFPKLKDIKDISKLQNILPKPAETTKQCKNTIIFNEKSISNIQDLDKHANPNKDSEEEEYESSQPQCIQQ